MGDYSWDIRYYIVTNHTSLLQVSNVLLHEVALLRQQCPKLRVHPAPGAHISTAGCTILGGVHRVCARFLSCLLLLYIERLHGKISGCTFLGEVHPVGSQNKSLISDTGQL